MTTTNMIEAYRDAKGTPVLKESTRAIYRIVRFYKRDGARPRTIRSGLTLAEARAHCSRPDTSSHSTDSAAWFDGYDYMKGYDVKDE